MFESCRAHFDVPRGVDAGGVRTPAGVWARLFRDLVEVDVRVA